MARALPVDLLVDRALGALRVTPGWVAACEGLDATAVPELLAGRGKVEDLLRLARALERQSEEMRALADELTAAAGQEMGRSRPSA